MLARGAAILPAMAQALLEPVAAGQVRFRAPGLAPDARGVAVGAEVLVVLSTMERVVAFLGAYSQESSLDQLLTTLTIERGRRGGPGGGHEMLLRFSAGDSHAVDPLARLCAAVRGRLYTGAGAVFVRWRDRRSPFGYDLAELVSADGADVVAVDEAFSARYRIVDRIDPVDLILRLELRPDPSPREGPAAFEGLDRVLVLAAPGLRERALSYLWRVRADFAGCGVRLGDDERDATLLRVRRPEARWIWSLHRIPGVEILRPVSGRVAVEVGFRHPIDLRSAAGCFVGEEVLLFRGHARRVERLSEPPRFVEGRHLVRAEGAATLPEAAVEPASTGALEALRVDLRLRRSERRREPRGVWVPWEQAELLRRLVYLVPPDVLAASALAPLADGLVVLGTGLLGARSAATLALSTGSLLPVGRRLCEVAPGVLVPDGYEPWPRVLPELLRELLGLPADEHALFLQPDAPPLRLPAERLLPLDAATMAAVVPEDADWAEVEAPAREGGLLDYGRLGRFALWGFGRAEAAGGRARGELEAAAGDEEDGAGELGSGGAERGD